jgi:pyruvate/2-oxoglutarate dehydrogenase complex dihydrolipoamide dehydrogenase (E3) component
MDLNEDIKDGRPRYSLCVQYQKTVSGEQKVKQMNIRKKNVNVLIIGSGQGGVPLAEKLAKTGQSVVLFEREHLGGCCINFGCTPSKMLLAAAHLVGSTQRAEKLGIHLEAQVDFPRIMNHIRETVSTWRESIHERITASGVALVENEARFVDDGVVQSAGKAYKAPLIVINTGKSPLIPPIKGIREIDFLTYESLWSLEHLPESVLIVGGGFVGVEMGQALARLGSQITIVDPSDRILSHEEKNVSTVLQDQLAHDGVSFKLRTRVDSVEKAKGEIRASLSNGENVSSEKVLIAAGRKPNTARLQASQGGVQLDKSGHIRVDEKFQTTAEGVYAIGDVTGQPAFTHVSWEDHRRLLSIVSGGGRRQGDKPRAYAVFTEPQIGRAGLSLKEAQEQDFDPVEVTLDLSQIARASETGQVQGFFRLVVDEATERILGATLVSPCAAELIHVIIAHKEADAPWQLLEESMYIHPSFAEGLPSLARLMK